MLVHSVFFWLKDDLSEDDMAEFAIELEGLKEIELAEAVYVGTPGPTGGRAVVDDTYDFALTVILKGMEAHDAYQVHPVHKAFAENNKDKWRKVQVYDAL
jgi:hypothetical protein